jgi:RNA polymerase sigma factor (sigma-70 family)
MTAPTTTTTAMSDSQAPAAPLVERHRGWLERLVAARTCCRDAVDDVLQEVAVAVARSSQPPVAAEERPWLCAIAIRQCALFLRTSSRRLRLVARAAERLPPDAGRRLEEDPIYWLMSREDAGLVARAVDTLAADDRQLLHWKYIDGLTYPELASRLGVARHVAEYRVVAAKKRLRGLLVEIGLGEDDAR